MRACVLSFVQFFGTLYLCHQVASVHGVPLGKNNWSGLPFSSSSGFSRPGDRTCVSLHWWTDYLTLDHLRSLLALNGLTRRDTAHSSSSRRWSVGEALDCVWFWLWYLRHFPSLGLCHHLLKESVELDRLSSSFRGHVSCSATVPLSVDTEQALGMNYRLNAQRTHHVPGNASLPLGKHQGEKPSETLVVRAFLPQR